MSSIKQESHLDTKNPLSAGKPQFKSLQFANNI